MVLGWFEYARKELLDFLALNAGVGLHGELEGVAPGKLVFLDDLFENRVGDILFIVKLSDTHGKLGALHSHVDELGVRNGEIELLILGGHGVVDFN